MYGGGWRGYDGYRKPQLAPDILKAKAYPAIFGTELRHFYLTTYYIHRYVSAHKASAAKCRIGGRLGIRVGFLDTINSPRE